MPCGAEVAARAAEAASVAAPAAAPAAISVRRGRRARSIAFPLHGPVRHARLTRAASVAASVTIQRELPVRSGPGHTVERCVLRRRSRSNLWIISVTDYTGYPNA